MTALNQAILRKSIFLAENRSIGMMPTVVKKPLLVYEIIAYKIIVMISAYCCFVLYLLPRKISPAAAIHMHISIIPAYIEPLIYL